MAKLNFENRWVLITGASSGLGREMARHLAAVEKANLIVTARRKERLEQLKKEIESTHPVRVEVLPADLNRDEDVDRLFKRATETAEVYALINNAGLTGYGKTNPADMDAYEKIMNVNFKALMKLSLRFLSYFIERGNGALLNITSLGAYIPIPYQNVYAASKHAARVFTEGLFREYHAYRKKGVFICSFAPGGIRTELLHNSGLDQKYPADSPFNMKADVAARKAINAFKKKKYVSVPGAVNKLALFLAVHLPRHLVTWAAEFIYRPLE
jgi:hypothetical protein